MLKLLAMLRFSILPCCSTLPLPSPALPFPPPPPPHLLLPITDLLWPVLCGGEPLSYVPHLHGACGWPLSGQEEAWDAPSHLRCHWPVLQEHAPWYVPISIDVLCSCYIQYTCTCACGLTIALFISSDREDQSILCTWVCTTTLQHIYMFLYLVHVQSTCTCRLLWKMCVISSSTYMYSMFNHCCCYASFSRLSASYM